MENYLITDFVKRGPKASGLNQYKDVILAV